MKIKYNNQDLKIINWNRGYKCLQCALNSNDNLLLCSFFCRSGKIWVEDTCNSGIFYL